MQLYPFINFLISVIIFAIAAYGLFWVCERAKMPLPAFWISGAILMIIILLFIANQMGVGGGRPYFFLGK